MDKAFSQFLTWESTTRDTIDFKKIYVDMADDLIAGLVLSQIIFWYLPDKNGKSKLKVFKEEHYWIAKSNTEWWDEIRITEKQAGRATKILEDKGIIVKKYFMFNGNRTTHIRLNQAVFMTLWQQLLQGGGPVTTKGGDRSPPKGATITETTTETTTKTLSPDGEKEKPLADNKANSRDPTDLPNLTPEQELDLWFGGFSTGDGETDLLLRLQGSGWKRILTDSFLMAACFAFLNATGWDIPASHSERKYWANEFDREWREFTQDALNSLCKQSYDEMMKERMNVDSPRSLTKKMRHIWRNEWGGKKETEEELVITWKETGERVT